MMGNKRKIKPKQLVDIIESIWKSAFVEAFLTVIGIATLVVPIIGIVMVIAIVIIVHIAKLFLTGHVVGAVIEIAIITGIIATAKEQLENS